MRGHDRFESLAGAVALGEATPAERDLFAAHAAGCDACRREAEDAASVLPALALSRDEETWRPSLDGLVGRRIREARARRERLTFGALAWGVALSLALDVAFVTGFSARLATAFRANEPHGVLATRLHR